MKMLQNNLKISKSITGKLISKHNVTVDEVFECFLNRIKGLLEDTRVNHKTNPPTLWFISETDHERRLKIVFIQLANGGYEVKTAYEPNDMEVKIYEQYA